MISLFRSNDPLRLIFGIIFFLMLLSPLIWIDTPYTTSTLVHNLIGDKVSKGFWMYKDLWDYEGLFSAYTFGLTSLSANNRITNRILAIIVIIAIIVQVSMTMNKNETYSQKNYLTTYFLILSFFTSYTLLDLSPQLLSLLFLSFSLNLTLKHFSGHLRDENRILLGLWHGIASLYYFPCTIFFVLHLLFFAAFTKLKISSYFLSIFGFMIPYTMICIIYYTQGSLFDFLNRAVLAYFQFKLRENIGLIDLMYVGAPLLVWFLYSYIKLTSTIHNNIQSTCKGLMFMWFLCAIALFVWSNYDIYNLCYLCIPFAYTTSYMFLQHKKNVFRSLLALTIPATILGFFWTDLVFPIRKNVTEKITIKNADFRKGHKILVLGEDLGKFNGNQIATKYFFWPMAQKHFKRINSYAGITIIYTSIFDDKPEIVYDKLNLMPKLIAHIPELGSEYRTTDNKTYFLIK